MLSIAEPEIGWNTVARAAAGRQTVYMANEEAMNADVSAASPEDLVLAIADRQSRAAFAELFRRLGPKIKGYVRRLGADSALAEDLAQDVMLTIWRRAKLFDPAKASVNAWVFTIARNRRIDVLRRQNRPEPDPNDPMLVREAEPLPDQGVTTGQESVLVRNAMRTLPPEQAELLKMAYYEEKSHSMIAEELELPLGTVKSRLRLAMGKLRVALETIR